MAHNCSETLLKNLCALPIADCGPPEISLGLSLRLCPRSWHCARADEPAKTIDFVGVGRDSVWSRKPGVVTNSTLLIEVKAIACPVIVDAGVVAERVGARHQEI